MTGLLGPGEGLAGIFAPPPVAPPVRTTPVNVAAPPPPNVSLYERIKSGIMGLPGAVGQTLGGPNDPNLSDEQNRAAQQQAMLMAGLQMLAASGPSTRPVGLGEILAQGVATGQQAGQGQRAQMYQQTQAERVRQALADPEIIGKLTPQQQALIRLLPPAEAAAKLAEIAFAPGQDPKVVGEGGALVGPDGRVIYENAGTVGGPDFPSELEAILWSKGVDPATMTPEQRREALQEYVEVKRTGGTTINIGDKAAQQEFTNVNALAGSYEQAVAEHQAIATSYLTVKAAAQDPSPAGDLSLIFAYMKMLDPTSVVREGEQAQASNAAGVPDRIRNMYNRLLTGERLNPQQRADFINQAEQQARRRQQQLRPLMQRYRSRAEARGLPADQIVFDPFEEVGLSGEAPAASAYPLFEDVQ